MKKLLLCAAFIVAASAQAQTFGERVTLEASYGFNAPINPTEDSVGTPMEAADYSGFGNLQLGATYQINEDWGVRGTYMYANFKNKDLDNMGTQIHKLAAEAVYTVYSNAAKSLHSSSQEGFVLYAHAGGGIGINTSKMSDTNDFIGNLQIGIKPTYHFADRWAVFLDPTYVLNFSQHSGFDGRYLDANSDGKTGSFYTINLGVSVRLGR